MAAELEFDVTENIRQVMEQALPKEVTLPKNVAQTTVQAFISNPSVEAIKGPFAALMQGVKSFLGGFLGMFKSKKAFIAAVVLVINWIVLSILESKGIDPAPVKILSWATFGGGVGDRTALGILGNIAGRSVVATMIISLFQGGPKQFANGLKQMFSKKISETAIGLVPQELKDGVSSVRAASVQAKQTVDQAKQNVDQAVAKAKNEVNKAKDIKKSGNLTWFIMGVGLSLMLYEFFTGAPSLTKSMAGISGAFVAVAALGKKNGWIRTMAEAFTAKKTEGIRKLNEAGTKRLMAGITAGFAAAVPLSALPIADDEVWMHLHLILGIALVLLALIVAAWKDFSPATLWFIFFGAALIAVIGLFGSRFVEPMEQEKKPQSANTGTKPVEPKGASYGNGKESDLYVAEDGRVAFYDLGKNFVCMVSPLNGFSLDREDSRPSNIDYILDSDADVGYSVWCIGDNTKKGLNGKMEADYPDYVLERTSLGYVAGGTREIFKGHETYTSDYRGAVENWFLFIPYQHTDSKTGETYTEALTVQFEDTLAETVSKWTDEQWQKAARMIFGQ